MVDSPDQNVHDPELDTVRPFLTRFATTRVHLKYGQFRAGMTEATETCDELLKQYRQTPGEIPPAVMDAQFDGLDDSLVRNPVQMALFIDHMDRVYRVMLVANPLFGLKLADLWVRVSERVPLRAVSLNKAVFWIERATKQQKELTSQYGPALEELKDQLEEARKKEGAKPGPSAGKREKDNEKEDDKEDNDKDEHEAAAKRQPAKPAGKTPAQKPPQGQRQ